MNKMSHVMLYCAYEKELAAYSDAQIGRMLMGLVHYVNTGEEYVPKGAERYIWPTLFSQLQRNLESYEEKCATNKANSAKAMEARKRRNAQLPTDTERLPTDTERLPTDTERLPTDTERLPIGQKENEKENEKENKKENEKENESVKEKETGADTRFSPPDVDAVLEYCSREALQHVDPKRFVDYYTATGWKLGGKPVENWQALVRMWNERDKTDREENDEHYSAATRFGVLL